MSCYMVYTQLRVILVAGLRCVSFLLYVVRLGVIYRLEIVTVHQRTTNCEHCQCMGQYRIAHTSSVP